MKKYYLCLDETGQFESRRFYNQASFVGGYLCGEKAYRALVEGLPVELGRLQSGEKKPVQVNGLHFRELTDKKELLQGLCSWWSGFDLTLIQSSGMPLLNLHPQQAYSHALLAVIFEAVDFLVRSSEDVDLQVWYALRGGELLTTIEQANFKVYQETVRSMIQTMACHYSGKTNVTVSVNYGWASVSGPSGRPDLQLVLADLVVGEIRSDKKHLLEKGIPLLRANVQQRISLQIRPGTVLPETADQEQPVAALLTALELFCGTDPQKADGDRIKRIVRQDPTGTVAEVFLTALKQFYLEWRDLNSDLSILERAAQLAAVCLDGQQPRRDLLQLKEQGLYYLLHVAAHRGQGGVQKSAWDAYKNYMQQYGEAVYPGLPERISATIEALLIGVQELYFNVLDFDPLEAELQQYSGFYRNFRDAGTAQFGKLDSLGARINGTEGQALAFTGCRDDDADRLELAEEYLEEDLKMLAVDDPFYLQGLSFLHSLHWWKMDTAKCQRYLSRILGTDCDDDSIAGAAGNMAEKRSDLFKLVDWLRYTALRGEQGAALAAEVELLQSKIMPWIEALPPVYPLNLAAKWICVICTMAKAPVPEKLWESAAAEILAEPLGTLFSVSGRMLRRSCNGKVPLSKEDEKRLRSAAENFPGVKRLLSSRLEQFRQKCSPFEAARFLPYYYS